jgi:hypothetical protein
MDTAGWDGQHNISASARLGQAKLSALDRARQRDPDETKSAQKGLRNLLICVIDEI